MDLLVYLARHPGEVHSRERILQAVWPDAFVTDQVLTNAIAEIRRVLGDDPAAPAFIQTVPRRGYVLIATVVQGVETQEERHIAVSVTRKRAKIVALGLAAIATAAGVFWFLLSGQTAEEVEKVPNSIIVVAFENQTGDRRFDHLTESMEAYTAFVRGREAWGHVNYEQARRELERAFELDPDFAMALVYLGQVYWGLGELDARDRVLRRASSLAGKLPEKERLLVQACNAWIVNRNMQEGREVLEELLAKYPDEKRYAWELGHLGKRGSRAARTFSSRSLITRPRPRVLALRLFSRPRT